MKRIPILTTIVIPVISISALIAQTAPDDEEEVFSLSPFCVSSPGFGATPGGAQDINYARAQIKIGKIPHPNTFRAEGLLSEHDLPLDAQIECETRLCVYGEAMPAEVLEMRESTHIAQIGFASGLDPNSWQRRPLNLIAVVDKSGSMNGQPLQLVRESLLAVLDQLGEEDQLSIVLYGDRSHVHLPPIPASEANRNSIQRSIAAIASLGSTNMEDGLRVGYKVARNSAAAFDGATRLMLFTDERPNTGNTSKGGFMGQMREGSKRGFGLTTIGVGVQFGAELANAISSARGGNLFYFPDCDTMVETFETEFSTMVTELAYDFELNISPARGLRLTGVYGIPGDMLKWSQDGRSLSMKVETLFLSLRKGAIYFTLGADGDADLPPKRLDPSYPIATTSIGYKSAGTETEHRQRFDFRAGAREEASLGLTRGELLINQYVSLKKATTAHRVDNDQTEAYRIVQSLSYLLEHANDPELDAEQEMVARLERELAFLSGMGDELSSRRSPLSGTWIAHQGENPDIGQDLLIQFVDEQAILLSELEYDGEIVPLDFLVSKAPFDSGRRGKLGLMSKREFDSERSQIAGLPADLEETFSFLDDFEKINYRLRGKALVLHAEKRGGEDTSKLVLRRYKGPKENKELLSASEIEPISGLPAR